MTTTETTTKAQRTLGIWTQVQATLDRPAETVAVKQLAVFADPTAPLALFDLDAPDWHHER
jgi:hypothetical protein